MNELAELLRARKLRSARVGAAFYEATGTWEISVREGGTEIAAASATTLEGAYAEIVQRLQPGDLF